MDELVNKITVRNSDNHLVFIAFYSKDGWLVEVKRGGLVTMALLQNDGALKIKDCKAKDLAPIPDDD